MIPIFVNLEGFKVAIFGFGEVGKRRAKKLLKADADVDIYSKTFDTGGFEKKINFIKCDVNEISDEDLEKIIKKYDIIVAAIDKKNNDRIVKIAKRLGKFVNSATFEDEANLIIPACTEVGGVLFAVYTKGKSPLIAREIRKLVENYLLSHEEDLIIQSYVRENLKEKIDNQKKRKEILEELFRNDKFKKELLKLIEKYSIHDLSHLKN
ncbi:precorrin-2 dehydrogenase/sirohydrochlorin ferrochelatase family protein [Methanotorris formicicus]|uniref:precorrin-2 dehydrogenase n=1 Tax=Methanotorris formicicus Mc-S-70 TaxID=647171 RepID=H1KXB7_9EURY|nr:bifunctional precorrin-2 dehydrogenase/sirohydrochlorin ferrochelatase [Methanotorris formicicus]EHP88329.1 siroheme synthase [Methanotorris formicicus Mc-S-70]